MARRVALPALLLLSLAACTHSGGTKVRLDLVPVAAGSDVASALAARLAGDPDAESRGLRVETEHWSHFPSGAAHRDHFLLGPDKATLERYVEGLIRDGDLIVPEGETVAYGPDLNHPGGWRTFVLRESEALKVAEVAGLRVIDDGFGHEAVALHLTPEDGEAFGALTGRIVGYKLAIVVDGEVESAPVVQEAITGGRLQISLTGDPDGLLRRLRVE